MHPGQKWEEHRGACEGKETPVLGDKDMPDFLASSESLSVILNYPGLSHKPVGFTCLQSHVPFSVKWGGGAP